MSYKKDFDQWNGVKKGIQGSDERILFQDRDVWWCKIGVNVGYEIDGKSELFIRPVLVVKKITANTFIGIPLTRKRKDVLVGKKLTHLYYILKEDIPGKGGEMHCSVLDLSQVRLFDARRLVSKEYRMYDITFNKVKTHLRDLFL